MKTSRTRFFVVIFLAAVFFGGSVLQRDLGAKTEAAKPKATKPKVDEAAQGAKTKKASQAGVATEAKVGKPAPGFQLKDATGKTHDLSSYKGKVVVLEWTNPNCPFVKRHCEEEKGMQTLAKEYKGKSVVWFSVNSTSPSRAHDFMDAKALSAWAKKNGVEHAILLDPEGKTGHAYGAKTTPHMFVIDQKGTLAYAGAIDNDAFGAKDRKVRTNYVKMAVDELLAGKKVTTTYVKPYGCSVKYAPTT